MSILLKIATQMSTPTPRRPLVRRHAPYTEDQYEDQACSQPHVQAFSPQCLSLEVLITHSNFMLCTALHCHCFLLPSTKQDWPFFGPCLDSHSHSMSGLVPVARLVQCAVVIFVTPKLTIFNRPDILGI